MGAAAARRPFIFVLAGVNGAGKSSVGGAMLAEHGLDWYNPDRFARELVAALGIDIADANGRAWEHGRARLEAAIESGCNFAFETTLGARTIPDLLTRAARSHDVSMIFCGLASPELHLRRVRARGADAARARPGRRRSSRRRGCARRASAGRGWCGRRAWSRRRSCSRSRWRPRAAHGRVPRRGRWHRRCRCPARPPARARSGRGCTNRGRARPASRRRPSSCRRH